MPWIAGGNITVFTSNGPVAMRNLPPESFRIPVGNYARAAVEVYVRSRGGYITKWASTAPYGLQPVRSYGEWCLW